MTRLRSIKTLAALALALAALGLLAAGAIALVKVYSNDFSNQDEADQLAVSGKGCNTKLDSDNKRLDVTARKGPTRCRLKVPVQGDAAQPDQAISVTAKLDKDTPNSIAKKTYFSVTLRDGSGGLYEFRVYPGDRRYSLDREPAENGFPVEGGDKAIGRPGDRNFIRLQADGATLKAKVNGAKLDPVKDDKASEVAGRRMTVTFGVEGKTSDPVSGWIDDLVVQVPTP